jgi:succinoglycan biosynthesis protein ExoM
MPESPLVCVAVCTRARPKMLRACLRSLVHQQPPAGWRLVIVVLENNPNPGCAAIVEEEARSASCPIHHLHEPELGIPIARNTALRKALELKADWIAFLDDDETASPQWISTLCGKAVRDGVDIVNGPVHYQYPDQTAPWFKRRAVPTSELKAGSLATNNIVFRASLVAANGLNLRFDEGMRYTGGSDVEFFGRAVGRGATAAWCPEAYVVETVPPSRLTLQWQLKRAFRTASNDVETEMQQGGLLRALARRLPKNFLRLIGGVLSLPILVFWPTRLPVMQRLGFKSLKSTVSGIGGLSRFFGFRPQPYRNIDGE